jgi:hypothetical protein
MQYKNTRKTILQIGRELEVSHVVEGSVRRVSGRVRITAQLIQVSDQTHLWAESYERDTRDILALQNEVTRAIARQIQIRLIPQETERLSASGSTKAAYGTMLQQRRRSVRCPVEISVVPTIAELGRIEAKITDISIGGLALQCKCSLQIGWTVSLPLSPPGTDDFIHVTGKVVNADKKGRAGICFSRLPEQDLSRLVDWLAIELSKLENAELPVSDFPES